jgi:hypothetical protein
MFARSLPQRVDWALMVLLSVSVSLVGCGRAPSPVDAPMRYNSTDALRERLSEVAHYGDGGSSLGGISESIEALTKSDPEKGAKLLASFQRLDTTDSKDERKKIAKEMVEQLK